MSDFSVGDPGPGLTAFLIFLGLAVATALLLWSMTRQLRKVPKDLDVPTGREGKGKGKQSDVGSDGDASDPLGPPAGESTDH